jgi:hypothetical protein
LYSGKSLQRAKCIFSDHEKVKKRIWKTLQQEYGAYDRRYELSENFLFSYASLTDALFRKQGYFKKFEIECLENKDTSHGYGWLCIAV